MNVKSAFSLLADHRRDHVRFADLGRVSAKRRMALNHVVVMPTKDASNAM